MRFGRILTFGLVIATLCCLCGCRTESLSAEGSAESQTIESPEKSLEEDMLSGHSWGETEEQFLSIGNPTTILGFEVSACEGQYGLGLNEMHYSLNSVSKENFDQIVERIKDSCESYEVGGNNTEEFITGYNGSVEYHIKYQNLNEVGETPLVTIIIKNIDFVETDIESELLAGHLWGEEENQFYTIGAPKRVLGYEVNTCRPFYVFGLFDIEYTLVANDRDSYKSIVEKIKPHLDTYQIGGDNTYESFWGEKDSVSYSVILDNSVAETPIIKIDIRNDEYNKPAFEEIYTPEPVVISFEKEILAGHCWGETDNQFMSIGYPQKVFGCYVDTNYSREYFDRGLCELSWWLPNANISDWEKIVDSLKAFCNNYEMSSDGTDIDGYHGSLYCRAYYRIDDAGNMKISVGIENDKYESY